MGSLVGTSSWTIARRVIGALLLRELLTRYGRNNIGFLWLFVEPRVLEEIERLYDEPDAQQRIGRWRWLLGWTAPRTVTEPTK